MCIDIQRVDTEVMILNKYNIVSQKLEKGSLPKVHRDIVTTNEMAIKLEEELNKNNVNKQILFQVKKTKRRR